MSRQELANLKRGALLLYPGFDLLCEVKEVMPLKGILVEIDETQEQVFVNADEVLDDLEVFV
jgi:hypothetical protein